MEADDDGSWPSEAQPATVVIASANRPLIAGLRRALTGEFAVRQCGSAPSAVDAAREHHSHLVLLDAGLPDVVEAPARPMPPGRR